MHVTNHKQRMMKIKQQNHQFDPHVFFNDTFLPLPFPLEILNPQVNKLIDYIIFHIANSHHFSTVRPNSPIRVTDTYTWYYKCLVTTIHATSQEIGPFYLTIYE
jgi:hypothetical protein